MITEHDLKEAIAECEGQRNPTANTCMKLAAFYILKDKMYPDMNEPIERNMYSYAKESTYNSDTEFMKKVQGRSLDELLPIMDELMTTLQALHPRLYEAVMREL